MSTFMAQEIAATPQIIAQQLDDEALQNTYADAADALKALRPCMMMTVARGTSDHAAEYGAYHIMRYSGLPVLSVPLSLNTHHQAPWHLPPAVKALVLCLSQSGGSDDLVHSARHFRKERDFHTWALVNVEHSPLAQACHSVLAVGAGEERSVAATKSFIATVTAFLRIFEDYLPPDVLPALEALPQRLEEALAQDWSALIPRLKNSERLYVVGRGAGLAIAKEAALKFKETCLLQAEAFSGAEVKHGPWALMNERQQVLILAPEDEHLQGLCKLAQECRDLGADVMLAAPAHIAERDVTLVNAGHDVLQGLTTILSFYRFIEALSQARGIDTDNPPNLNKVTRTR